MSHLVYAVPSVVHGGFHETNHGRARCGCRSSGACLAAFDRCGCAVTRLDEVAAAFSMARPRLISIAYAILGSRAEAEDVVADMWLRLVNADAQETVRDVTGWATVAVA